MCEVRRTVGLDTNIPAEILKASKNYIAELNRRGFPVSAAYIFGSYARGGWNAASDIDIAIISEAFVGNRYLDGEKLNGLNENIDLRISALPFTPADFENSILLAEIVTMGVRIV